nr:hypothetical protein [Cressdnaviricota sp.]UOF78347.1 hypothetical protein [Cressdnaviricota sp.]UOF78967.1 hypothetical protein [Cressdnaviricota sp.]UOF78973.1 hypothetical protein [Cressdnaviricota sp.]UOF79967.1 hypothetical protein [Cressdnaviricota sp.]
MTIEEEENNTPLYAEESKEWLLSKDIVILSFLKMKIRILRLPMEAQITSGTWIRIISCRSASCAS